MVYEARLTSERQLTSIFFGGGTPSLMPPETVASLLREAERLWGFCDDIEITLEANPSSVEASRFADLARAGINRISLGLQSLDDEALAFLGRAHSVHEGLSALETAQNHFARVSFDLIYALPQQSETQWKCELQRAIGFGTGHLSLYQLTIEPGTRFETMVRLGNFTPADDDHGATLYDLTRHITEAAGIGSYEISNHAREGEQSRHNLCYWRYQDYIGIGPGAHGRRLNYATQRHKKPENYLSAIARNGHGLAQEMLLDPATRATEALLMGLRLDEGVNLLEIAEKCGVKKIDLIDKMAVSKLIKLDFITLSGDHLRVTPKGMPLLDAILPQIVAI